MGLFNLFKPAKTVLVVDALSLNESMGLKGKVAPRNQLQMLRRLSRFAQREKIETIAVLSGSPLNKAPAGKKFDDILVIYSKSPEVHAKFLAKTASGKGAGAIVVSGSAAVEKLIAPAIKTMRVSTFRKAFDVGGDSEGFERSGGGGGGNSRRPQRRRQKSSGNNNNNSNEPKQARPPKAASSEADAINELIDLVD